MDTLTGHPSSPTSKPPILDQWPDWWISSLQASRANHTQQPDDALARLIHGTFGRIPSQPLAQWHQPTSCWRTFQASFLEMENGNLMGARWSGSFPISGMTHSGNLYPQQPLVPRILEGDGGAWHIPSPTVSDLYTGNLESTQQSEDTNHSVTLPQWAARFPTPSANKNTPNTADPDDLVDSEGAPWEPGKKPYDRRTGKPVTTTLADMVRYPTPQAADGSDVKTGFGLRDYVNHKRKYMLPTPTASDAPDGGGPPNKNANTTMWDGVNSLGQMAKQGYWPTPNVRDYKDTGENTDYDKLAKKSKLAGVVLATPQSRDHRIGGRDRYDDPDRSNNLNDQVGGKLSAAWVEWLMGLPEGWVNQDPLPGGSEDKWFELAGAGIWWDEERGLPRVVETQTDRVSKLKALGNGIVPACIPIFLRVWSSD